MLFKVLLSSALIIQSALAQTDYCGISSAHTMCLYQGPSVACGNLLGSGVSDSEKATIVHLHNQVRAKVANGQEDRGSPGPMPSASNMKELQWDDEIASVAQRWAEQCSFGHDQIRDVSRFAVGQNVFMSSSTDSSAPVDWDQAINGWYDEVKDYSNQNIDISRFSTETGHFTQVVWADTSRIGCGSVVYKDEAWVNRFTVCNYGSAGNFGGQRLYQRGEPCSSCPEGTSCSSAHPGLCADESRASQGFNSMHGHDFITNQLHQHPLGIFTQVP